MSGIIITLICILGGIFIYYVFVGSFLVGLIVGIGKFLLKWVIIPGTVIYLILFILGKLQIRKERMEKEALDSEHPLGKLNLEDDNNEKENSLDDNLEVSSKEDTMNYSKEIPKGIIIGDGVYNTPSEKKEGE